MSETLNFNEVAKFMKEFRVDFLNRFGELIIDSKTNTFADINIWMMLKRQWFSHYVDR